MLVYYNKIMLKKERTNGGIQRIEEKKKKKKKKPRLNPSRKVQGVKSNLKNFIQCH